MDVRFLVKVCSKSRAAARQRQSAPPAVDLDQKALPRHPPLVPSLAAPSPSCFSSSSLSCPHKLHCDLRRPMKLTLRPEWRLRPLSSFLGFLDIKTGVTIALLFAVSRLECGLLKCLKN